ncbi:MAG: hypothetical protein ACLGXA_02380 [Acidobacteriota bacterium]
MPFSQGALDAFLLTYEKNTTNVDPAKVVSQFADSFLAAGPAGSIILPAAAFAQTLPARKQTFKDAGHQSSQLIARRDTRIGDRYVLVYTQWEMDFAPEGAHPFRLLAASSFLIDMGGADPKILAYLAHQDVFELMKQRAVPATALRSPDPASPSAQ